MVYQGSKNRIANEIIPFMLPFLNGENWFIDAFCGGCNLIDKVNYPKRIANDKNEYLIALFQYLQNGGKLPEEIGKEEYYKVKANKDDYPMWYVGHVGFNCSRLGKFFDSFVLKNSGRNYQREHNDNIISQVPKFKNIRFMTNDYYNIPINKEDVVYCDPPYKNAKKYRDSFDSESFCEWCRTNSRKGMRIFISEYDMPDDFKCIWSKKLSNSLPTGETNISTEKLFVHESIYDEVMSKQQKTLF